jgi:hypothetical protein
MILPKAAVPPCIPISNVESSNFSTSLPTSVIAQLSHYSYPNGYGRVSHCDFDVNFSFD